MDRQSDSSIVPKKRLIIVEERGLHINKPSARNNCTREVKTVMGNDYTRIAEQQRKYGTVQGIMKYVNEESIKEQHRKQEKGKATGIDRVTKEEYGENLEENVKELIDRMKRLQYKPKDIRRTKIPKEGSKKLRPLGIPAYEDKLVQGVMAEILNQIYEPIFLDM